MVALGLRSIASTAMNEAEVDPDVIEATLTQYNKHAVRRTYSRSSYIEQRKELMAWWGNGFMKNEIKTFCKYKVS